MKKTLIATTVGLFTTATVLATEPPNTLPREFLAQLPLLLNLSEREFETLLTSAQQSPPPAETVDQRSAEEKQDEK